jgi:hypothetical protein
MAGRSVNWATINTAKSGSSTFVATNERNSNNGLRNNEVTARGVHLSAKLKTISRMLIRRAKRTSCAVLIANGDAAMRLGIKRDGHDCLKVLHRDFNDRVNRLNHLSTIGQRSSVSEIARHAAGNGDWL